jgi:hypothetical protein
MRVLCLLALGLFFIGVKNTRAEDPLDLAYKTRLIGEARERREDSVFARGLDLTSFGRDRARGEAEARGKAGPLSLLLTGTVAGQESGPKTSTRGLVNEAYVDFGAGELRASAGKKILSGDVGYGFRPIDVLQREQRLQVLPPALEGVSNLTVERFTGDTAYSLVVANPGHRERGTPKDDGSLALRYYRRLGATDLHGIARFSDRFKTEAGAAFAAVPHESVELHGSFLVQRRGERLVPLADPASTADLLAADRALETQAVSSPRKALAGLTWTWESGWSLLGEAWWDGTAPAAADWQRLAAQARRRSALAGLPGIPAIAVPGSLAASTRMFQQQSFARRNALARVSWTDPAGSGWSGALDLLRTLDDGGYSVTAALGWQADKLRIDAGVRRFGGRPDSAYRLLPERGIVFAGASLAF